VSPRPSKGGVASFAQNHLTLTVPERMDAMVHPLPIPSWNGLHPLIVHFPIALLLTAPLFVIIGTVLALPKGRAFLVSALILMALGTVSVFVAVETGEAASRLAGSKPAVKAALAQHENLALTTLLLFSVLTVTFAAFLFAPKLLQRELGRTTNTALLAAFLVFYATGALFLAKTAHQGARLVRELGIHTPVAASAVASTAHEGQPSALPEGTGLEAQAIGIRH